MVTTPWMSQTFPLRYLCVLCVSAVLTVTANPNRRDAENAEVAQRRTLPTFQTGVHYRSKRKFRFSVSIEEQGIVCSTSNWPVIQPCITVRHSPEGDSVNDVTVFQIHCKQLAVSFRLLLLNSLRQTRSKRVEFALQFWS